MADHTTPTSPQSGVPRGRAPGDLTSRADVWWLAVDAAAFYLLQALGASVATAQFFSLAVAAATRFAVRSQAHSPSSPPVRQRALRAALVALAALFLRGGLLGSLVQLLSVPPWVAILAASPLACVVNAWGSSLFVFPAVQKAAVGDRVWRRLVPGLVVYALLLKLCYMGLAELMHEEAYYWNYGQHLALGYLDHPPMVGWITALFTAGFGDTEFGVRAGAFLAWLVAAHYCHALTRRIFGAETARNAVLLYALLPAYFSLGLVVIPDTYLVMFWAGALYYLYMFLVEESPRAWWGVGICFGAGLLSKYTIVLLAGAALAFVLLDRNSRRWLRRRELYAAIGLAALLFSPVILWNATHDWASFAFQSVRRAESSYRFALPAFIGAVALLITPLGLLALPELYRARRGFASAGATGDVLRSRRAYRLMMLCAALPAGVFLCFSLFRTTKLNWTSPIWLATLPYLAQLMGSAAGRVRSRIPVYGRRPWLVVCLSFLLLYGGLLYYVTLGFPGVPYPVNALGQGWPEIARGVDAVVRQIQDDSGERPLVVGMDLDRISSWLAFYRGRGQAAEAGDGFEPSSETSGRHLFGENSNMYAFWFPAEAAVGKTLVLVGKKASDLTSSRVDSRIGRGGPVRELTAEHNGWTVRRNYVRVVEDYLGPAPRQ